MKNETTLTQIEMIKEHLLSKINLHPIFKEDNEENVDGWKILLDVGLLGFYLGDIDDNRTHLYPFNDTYLVGFKADLPTGDSIIRLINN